MPNSASTMGIIGVIFGMVFLVSIFVLLLTFIYSKLRRSKLSKEDLKFDKIRSIFSDLKKQKVPNSNRVFKSSRDIETRVLVFEVLDKFGKAELFPKEFLTIEKFSESYLSNWLYQHDDYETFPDEMTQVKSKKSDEQLFIFKFRSNEPHIFANKGWMYGYVLYDKANNKSYDHPILITSQFDNVMLTLDELRELI